MDWDDIRYFLTLCRDGSVTQAGKSLGVNHTTVARRIAAFERELGTRLFERTREGYSMTQAAEDMYEDAARMEECAHAIDRAMFGWDGALKGSLKLTAPFSLANALLTPKLATFRKRYPNIDLELFLTMDLLDLHAREADIALRLTPKPPEHLIGRKVLPLVNGIYTTEKYFKQTGQTPEVLVYRSQKGLPMWVKNHFPGAKLALRTDSVNAMHAVVRSGFGIASLPCFQADSDPELRRLDLPLDLSDWGIWVLSHVDLRSTARVRVCREFLIDVLQSQRSLVLGEDSHYM